MKTSTFTTLSRFTVAPADHTDRGRVGGGVVVGRLVVIDTDDPQTTHGPISIDEIISVEAT